MNKFLTALFAGAFALSIGTTALAADVVKSVEPTKTENIKVDGTAKTEVKKTDTTKTLPAKKTKKHHHKNSKNLAKAATPDAAAALVGK